MHFPSHQDALRVLMGRREPSPALVPVLSRFWDGLSPALRDVLAFERDWADGSAYWTGLSTLWRALVANRHREQTINVERLVTDVSQARALLSPAPTLPEHLDADAAAGELSDRLAYAGVALLGREDEGVRTTPSPAPRSKAGRGPVPVSRRALVALILTIGMAVAGLVALHLDGGKRPTQDVTHGDGS